MAFDFFKFKQSVSIALSTMHRRAIQDMWRHEQYIRERNARIQNCLAPSTPNYAHEWANGYAACLYDEITYAGPEVYHVFGIHLLNGFHSTHRDRDDYYEKLGFTPEEFGKIIDGCDYYWRKDTEKRW